MQPSLNLLRQAPHLGWVGGGGADRCSQVRYLGEHNAGGGCRQPAWHWAGGGWGNGSSGGVEEEGGSNEARASGQNRGCGVRGLR